LEFPSVGTELTVAISSSCPPSPVTHSRNMLVAHPS